MNLELIFNLNLYVSLYDGSHHFPGDFLDKKKYDRLIKELAFSMFPHTRLAVFSIY